MGVNQSATLTSEPDATCAKTVTKNVSVTTQCKSCSPKSGFLPYSFHGKRRGSRAHSNGPLLSVTIRDTVIVHACCPLLAHLHTFDDWRGFSAGSYGTVKCFTEEMNPAARRFPSAPSPSHVLHSPLRAGVVVFPVRHEEHLSRWCFHHGLRSWTWVLACG